MTHHIRKYSVIRFLYGERVVVPAFSCGPCGVYAKMYKTKKARRKAMERHLGNGQNDQN